MRHQELRRRHDGRRSGFVVGPEKRRSVSCDDGAPNEPTQRRVLLNSDDPAGITGEARCRAPVVVFVQHRIHIRPGKLG